MIDVIIHKARDHYTGFSVKGHAGYAEQGKDIVCAAVSALTLTLENSLAVLSGALLMEARYIGDEHPLFFIRSPNNKSDLLIEAFKIGIEGIQEEHPEYVKLHLETLGAFIVSKT